MAIDLTILEADFDNVCDDFPAVLVVGGVTITGSKSKMSKERAYSEHGFSDNYKTTFTGKVSDFTGGLPARDTDATLDGDALIVLKDAEEDSIGLCVIIHLGNNSDWVTTTTTTT